MKEITAVRSASQVAVFPSEAVAELGQVQKLRPTEADFLGKKGYRRRYRKDGSYEWSYRFHPNDHGKETSDGAMVRELMAPFQRADTERVAKQQSELPRIKVVDRSGAEHQVDPALADSSASRNGWSHRWRAGGVSVERGVDGMLFYRWRGAWQPTGRTQVGILGTPADRSTVQRDPDGGCWRFVNDEWRREDGGLRQEEGRATGAPGGAADSEAASGGAKAD